MTSREQFEKWFPSMVVGMPENMVKVFDEMLFMAWQASRSAIEIGQMKALTTRDALNAGYTADYATGVEHGLQIMEQAIESAGLKVNP